jgi:hypothetical protein
MTTRGVMIGKRVSRGVRRQDGRSPAA